MNSAIEVLPKEKLMDALKGLKKSLVKPSGLGLAAFFQNRQLAKEYSQYVLEYKLVIKVDGGKRGRCVYVWNKGTKLTEKVVFSLLQRFNEYRKNTAIILKESSRKELMKELETINKKLDTILKQQQWHSPIKVFSTSE